MSAPNEKTLQQYYRWHSRIYDATRWSFLFGRERLMQELAILHPKECIEIGCGTGVNLESLHWRIPEAKLTGFDISDAMLQKAKKRLIDPINKGNITLQHAPFLFHPEAGQVDAVFASYALSMINPGYQTVIDHAWHQLKHGGYFGIVDFHRSNMPFFSAWMAKNHVRMEGHLLSEASRMFKTTTQFVKPAYGGLWHYFLWIGRKV